MNEPKRKRNLFDPAADAPYRLSRTRLQDFLDCPRCFYLDRRLGIEPPGGPSFSLNIAVDHLLKKEFDDYRQSGKPHPLMVANHVDAIPFSHPDLDTWRSNFKGICVVHQPSNICFTGAPDDVWQDRQGKLIIVDYKATSTTEAITLDSEWRQSYKRQMEMYQWLFANNGFAVAEHGYFLYFNARKDGERFDYRLQFDGQLIAHKGDWGWVDRALIDARACLEGELPPPAKGCKWCEYRISCKPVE